MAKYKHRCYWHCTTVCVESRTKMHGCVCKHLLQADFCKPIKFICAIWYITMKMCFTSIIEAIFKCRFNKDQRWSLASVCLPLYVYILELQNLLIVFHLLLDKQQFSVSKWSCTITCMQPKMGGIMEYFFFSLTLLFQRQWVLLMLGPPLFLSYFLSFAEYYLDFVFYKQEVWVYLFSCLLSHQWHVWDLL